MSGPTLPERERDAKKVRIDVELHAELERRARTTGGTIRELVEKAVRALLEERIDAPDARRRKKPRRLR